MKKIILISVFVFNSIYGFSQESNNCNNLNDIIYEIAKVKSPDTIKIYKQKIEFKESNVFFTKKNFDNYTFPTLGVDSEKVKKIIKELNFEYLSKVITNCENTWDLKTLDSNIIEYKEEKNSNTDKIVRYGISCPIFTKNKKIKFFYIEQNRGYLGGISTSVLIYKKVKKKWILYLELPISIS